MSNWEIVRDNKISNPNSEWEQVNSNTPSSPNLSGIYNFLVSHPKTASIISKPAELLAKPASFINNLVEKARLPSIAGGALQGLADTGISAANVPLELLGKKPISHPDLQKYLPQDELSKLAFTGGEIGGSIPVTGGTYSALGKLTPEVQGIKRLLETSGRGAVTGGIVGENLPGGRESGAITGGILPEINNFRPKVISNNIIGHKKNVENIYKQAYDDFFDKAEDVGVEKVPPPNIDFNRVLKNTQSHYHESLENYLKNPTLNNAHDAQSDLFRYIKDNKNQSLTKSQAKTYNQAVKARNHINTSIYTELNRYPESELNTTYANLSKGYKRDVVPYKDKNIINYQNKKLSGNKLIKSLLNNDEFMSKESSKYPELQLHQFINNPLGKWIAGGAAAGVSAGLGLKATSGYGNVQNNYYQK